MSTTRETPAQNGIALEIVTPSGVVVREQVDEVEAPGVEGHFGVLPGHRPFMSQLRAGELRYRTGKQNHYVAVHWGFAEVLPHKVTVLVETAERAERQGDLRVEVERRVAAREDKLEPLVGDGRLVHVVLHCLGHVEQAGLLGERAVAADAVDRPVPGGHHEPRPRARGRPFARPPLGCDRERLLGGLLGEVEVAEEADQGGHDAAPLVPKGLVDVYHSATGRTSTAPPMRAAGTREASSIAASRSSAS